MTEDDIFQEPRDKWKKHRVLYQMSKEEKSNRYQTFMTKYFTPEEFKNYCRELVDSNFWKEFTDKKFNFELDRGPVAFNGLQSLYSLIRKLKPNVFVETGIRFGGSSATILHALHMNGKGKLISIDKWTEQPIEHIGYFIPDNLKDKWEPIKGYSRDVLPTIKVPIDIFLHDSEHSYKNMYFEYEWAQKNVKEGGLIISHDIGANNAFFDFAHNYGLRFYLIESDFSGRYSFGVMENVKDNKEPYEPLHRLDPKREIKPIRKELYAPAFHRDNFDAGRAFVKRLEEEGFTIEKEELNWIKGTNDEYLVYKNGKKLCRIAHY
jgi:hypothetical protein